MIATFSELNEQPNDVPVEACRMDAGPFRFMDGDEGDYLVPVEFLARNSQPITHWYWGKIAHDMQGMKLHKERLPIDYAHDTDEVIGFMDQFNTDSEEGLVCRGALVLTPNKQNDKAAEVAHKEKLGVPYEASIDFSGSMILEQVDEGMTAEVNGYEFEGPGVIVRQWSLRGVAVCPYGADKNTSTKTFKEGQKVAVQFVMGEEKMADENTSPEADEIETEGEETTQPTEATEEADIEEDSGATESSGDSDQLSREVGQAYETAFGLQGLKWYFEGKSMAECSKLHADQLTAQNKKLRDEIAALKAGEGEESPAEFQDGGEGKKKQKQSGLPIRFASSRN